MANNQKDQKPKRLHLQPFEARVNRNGTFGPGPELSQARGAETGLGGCAPVGWGSGVFRPRSSEAPCLRPLASATRDSGLAARSCSAFFMVQREFSLNIFDLFRMLWVLMDPENVFLYVAYVYSFPNALICAENCLVKSFRRTFSCAPETLYSTHKFYLIYEFGAEVCPTYNELQLMRKLHSSKLNKVQY